jgi:hypothetical protein
MFLRYIRIYVPDYTVSYPTPPSKYSLPTELQILYEMKNSVFWVIMIYSSEKPRRFGGTHSLQIQGRRVSKQEVSLSRRQAEIRTWKIRPDLGRQSLKRPQRETMVGQGDSESAHQFQLNSVLTTRRHMPLRMSTKSNFMDFLKKLVTVKKWYITENIGLTFTAVV